MIKGLYLIYSDFGFIGREKNMRTYNLNYAMRYYSLRRAQEVCEELLEANPHGEYKIFHMLPSKRRMRK